MVLAVVAGLVAVLTITAWVLATNRRSPAPDPATPEGTVLLYLLAVAEDDDATMIKLLDPSLECSAPLPDFYQTPPASLSVASIKTTGDAATVVVDITEGSGGPFDLYEHEETFELIRNGSGWLITGEPWPVFACK
ncbi:hypothetical protein SAMN02745244_02099 [Tessaracoccus bendigoensis DSM 12906]|uniref:Lumazine-binding domain n=1 Tax=Tessaracoccus bendigoensis DSM 12906 TaxID=1123357 RepID=A0A1M6HWZ8_9ACTN|nr:hypothetical protein SAMN02745244_02099 [Tessaracoccus bendigoensis DSM 12906]